MLNLPQRTPQAAPYLVDTFRPHFAYLDPAYRQDAIDEQEATDRRTQVLLIGDEPTLQYSRRKILEAAGYTVRSVKSDVRVEELFLRGIEVVLLCHTVREEAAGRITSAFARLTPKITVLQIVALEDLGAERGMPGCVSARPADLLGAVAARLSH